ncbi:hypothetical protein [Mobilicoccus caccae]|uniref:hypothetical protein n=1 Tax=Mobilicoccus caccae TaxID=1859295 RepID=UPI0024E05E60|nr:hypothetical protein [Mobilicoccus caccae]
MGALIEGKSRISAHAEGEAPGLFGAEAEAEIESSVRAELMADGSSVTTMKLAGAVEVGEKADPILSPVLEKLPSVGKWKLDSVSGFEDVMGVNTAAVGIAAAAAVTLRTRPDGSATLERSVRTQKAGDDLIDEKQRVRVVSPGEAAAIKNDLDNGDVQGASEKLWDIATDVSGHDTERRELKYKVTSEGEYGAEGSVGAGAKASAEASAGYRKEELVSVNGVAR